MVISKENSTLMLENLYESAQTEPFLDIFQYGEIIS